MNELKKVFSIIPVWNYHKEEELLNKYSADGWQLKKVYFVHLLFERDNSKKYIYKLDYQILSEGSDKYNEYALLLADKGWEVVDNYFNGWRYLRKEYVGEDGDYELYTDNHSYNQFLYGVATMLAIVGGANLLIGLSNIIMGIQQRDYNVQLGSMNVLLGIFLVFIMFVFIKKYRK